MSAEPKYVSAAYCIILVAMLTLALTLPAIGQVETIDAMARGTSTQLGKDVSIKVIISRFSTQKETQALTDAFSKGGNDKLVEAMSKMKSCGRIQIPSTAGYDLAFAATVPTPTGRRVSFVTDRRIAFGEAFRNTPSQAYNLTAGEFDINDQDENKSAGVLYPATQLVINPGGELQFELRKNPWKLTNIIARKPKGKQ